MYDIAEVPLKDVVTEGSFVRVLYVIKGRKRKAFLHKQETIWNKGMENIKGMLGGVVGKSLKMKTVTSC